jgi:hypothetical protein
LGTFKLTNKHNNLYFTKYKGAPRTNLIILQNEFNHLSRFLSKFICYTYFLTDIKNKCKCAHPTLPLSIEIVNYINNPSKFS